MKIEENVCIFNIILLKYRGRIKMDQKKGLLIAFEGGEGSGKSTQIDLLRDYLEHIGREVVITREPGGTAEGEKIRKIILDPESKLTPMAELLLFEADRSIHIEYLIEPSIAAGKDVITDRYDDSTFCYQAAGRKLPLAIVRNINNMVASKCRPNLVFIIKVDAEVGLKRARSARGKIDRIEQEKIEFHNRVQDYYLKRAIDNPKTHRIIDGNKKILEVYEDIKTEVDKYLKNLN